MRCNALLFDLDGVLVDSQAAVEATWRRWAGTHDFDPESVLSVAHGRRSIDVVRQVAPHLDAEAEAAALAASESTTPQGVHEIPGARELLLRLPVRHWAIVTSGTVDVATFRLTYTRLPVPSVMVTADQISRGKPDPEGYLTAARRLGVDPADCVVVEDAPAGLEAARAAGMRSIGVAGTYLISALDSATYRVQSLAMLRVVSAPGTVPIELGISDA